MIFKDQLNDLQAVFNTFNDKTKFFFFFETESINQPICRNLKIASSVIQINSELISSENIIHELEALEESFYKLYKEYLFPILSECSQLITESKFELLVCLIKNSLKFMGFKNIKTGDLQADPQLLQIVVAIQISLTNSDWKTFPVVLSIYHAQLHIKIVLTSKSSLLVIKNENIKHHLIQNIEYANNFIERGKFVYNNEKNCVEFLTVLNTENLEDFEIQSKFLDLFSYSVDFYQKYAEFFFSCALETCDFDLHEIKLKQISAKAKDAKYSQFFLDCQNTVSMDFFIPRGFFVQKYEKHEFFKEIYVINTLKLLFEEFCHVKIDFEMLEIKYPDYGGLSLKKAADCKHNFLKSANEFVMKLSENNIFLTKMSKNLFLAKVFNKILAYFPNHSYNKYFFLVESRVSYEDKANQLIKLSGFIIKKRKNTKKIRNIEKDDFDFIDFQTLEGQLIENPIRLELIEEAYAKHLKVYKRELLSIPKLSYRNEILGYTSDNNKHYFVINKK